MEIRYGRKKSKPLFMSRRRKGKCGKELDGNVKLDQSSSGSQLYPVDLDIGIHCYGFGTH